MAHEIESPRSNLVIIEAYSFWFPGINKYIVLYFSNKVEIWYLLYS